MKPSIRLSAHQAEATCTLCGKCERVTAGDAILAALEATRRIVEHRKEKHGATRVRTTSETRVITTPASSHSVQGERSTSGRVHGRGPAAIALAGA